jgi:cell division protease FtsH
VPKDREPRRRPGPEPESIPPLGWLPLALLVVLLLALVFWESPFGGGNQIPYSEFKRRLAAGELRTCSVGEEDLRGTWVPADAGTDAEPIAFQSIRVDDPDLVEQLLAAGVEVSGRRSGDLLPLLLVWLLPLGLLLLLWRFLGQRSASASAGMMGFGRSRARVVAEHEVGVDFEDVAGCEEAKAELREVVQFLREPSRYQALGAKIPKGVLLVGPPGTGKTLLARAVAGEAGVPFFSLSGSEFVEMFVGVGAARVRDLFEQAKRIAPCIVFIDELDAVGRQRGVHLVASNDEREQTLNQLLVEMDGFEPNSGVILLSATNRPDILDAALLRPGRFDRQVVLDAPDAAGRSAILRVHARGKPLSPGLDLERVARETPGFSGADLANVMNEAALLAAREGSDQITQHILDEAVEKVVAGPERRSRRLDPAERRRVAYHESGHALVALLSSGSDAVHKISIVPRGRAALGYTLQIPESERHLLSQSMLQARVRGLLGGRAAEDLAFGEPSTGAQDDLERATALVRQMLTMFGMGESAGLAHCARNASPEFLGARGPVLERDCSEATAREIDQEVRSVLDAAYDEALALLSERRDALERIAHELLEHETLEGSDLERLLGDAISARDESGAPLSGAPPGEAPPRRKDSAH